MGKHENHCSCGECKPKKRFVVSINQDELSGIVTVIYSDTSYYQFSTNDITGYIEEEGELIGTINDINKVFTFAHIPIPNTFNFYLNGQKLKRNIDYTLLGNQITFVDAIYITDVLEINYKYL